MLKGYKRNEDGSIERAEYQVHEGQYHTKTGLPIYPTGNMIEMKGWEHAKAEEYSADHGDNAGDHLVPC